MSREKMCRLKVITKGDNMAIFSDAHHYNENSSVQSAEANYLLNKLNLNLKDKTLLDVGCGDGKISNFMHTFGAKVTGIDASEEMIDFARHNFAGCSFKHLAAENLLNVCETYSVITSFNCLHWIKDLNQALIGIRKVLEAGGAFLGLIYPRCENLWRAAELVEDLPKYRSDTLNFTNPYHFYSLADFEKMLVAAGFVETKLWEESKQASFENKKAFKDYIFGWLPHCSHYDKSFIDDWFDKYVYLTKQMNSPTITMDYNIIFFVTS
jgi:SAM-dependent methyltransferase